MIQRIVLSFLISFVLKQLEKFKEAIDWSKVKADVDVRVRALIPGTWFDDDAVKLVNTVLDALAKVLSSSDKMKALLELLAAQKYAEAAQALKDLLLGVWTLSAVAEEKSARAVLIDFQAA